MITPLVFTVLTVLSCPNTEIVNKTDEWSEADQHTLEVARIRCKEIYPKLPCLTYFEKAEQGIYNALCGEKR